jgi:hypothetical protein
MGVLDGRVAGGKTPDKTNQAAGRGEGACHQAAKMPHGLEQFAALGNGILPPDFQLQPFSLF